MGRKKNPLSEAQRLKRRKEARRIRESHRKLLANGGGRWSVTLQPAEYRALQGMSAYAEPVAYTIRRIVMEEALNRGLVSPSSVPPRMESSAPK